MAEADPLSKALMQSAKQRHKTLAEIEAHAAAITKGAGFSSPFLSVTDRQLADAIVRMEVRTNPVALVEQQDRFFARNGVRRGDDLRGAEASPFRSTGHGLERV